MNEHEAAEAPAANPYAPPEARLAVPAPAGAQRDLASRAVRLGAKLIDSVVIGVAAVVLAMAMPAFASSGETSYLGFALVLAGMAAVFLVNAWLLHRHGQTIGKKIVGIRIVRGDRSRCGLRRVMFLRALPFSVVGLIPVVGPLVSLVDALMIFGDDHRTLHDRLADTVVVTA